MDNEKIDVKENKLLETDSRILDALLQDKTTGQNIIWATDNYAHLGLPYFCDKPILPEYITGKNGEIIKPRINKSKAEQQSRIRNKAEVFTPSWICNMQNNLVDDAWFGSKYNFNVENEKG